MAGYNTWQKLGRQVRRDERAIRIFVPMLKKVEDPNTDEEKVSMHFGIGNVFDYAQTDGEEFPKPPEVPVLESEDGGILYDHLAPNSVFA